MIPHCGSCHCGSVSVEFSATRPLTDLPLGRCDCSFCRRHGARTVADPGGALVIRAAAGALNRYRFGLRITDFLLCATCGVYVAALIKHEGRDYATLNANMLDALGDVVDVLIKRVREIEDAGVELPENKEWNDLVGKIDAIKAEHPKG